MSTLTLSSTQVILLLIAVLAIYGMEMAFFYWRLRRHNFAEHFALLRLQQLEQKLQALQRQLYPEPHDLLPPSHSLTTTAAAPVAEPPVNDRPGPDPDGEAESMEAVTPDGGASYNRAIDLARTGADAAILSRHCGLSRGEADLIVSLYGPRRK